MVKRSKPGGVYFFKVTGWRPESADQAEYDFAPGIVGQQNETGVDHAVQGQALSGHAAQAVEHADF